MAGVPIPFGAAPSFVPATFVADAHKAAVEHQAGSEGQQHQDDEALGALGTVA
jgi:hypothetical protein